MSQSRLSSSHGAPRFAPLRIDCGRSPCLSDSPSRRGVIAVDGRTRLQTPPTGNPTTTPQYPLQNPSYHSPFEGESQKLSRMAKADAVGGRRRRGFGATRAVEAGPSRFVALRALPIATYATPRLPPSGSTAGCALVSPTPPQGGSDTGFFEGTLGKLGGVDAEPPDCGFRL